ncbi:MAG: hypothetical protein ACLQLE_11995 [Desulfobaccales bacterium]
MNPVQQQIVPAALWRNRRVRMFPIWFFEAYLTFTVLVFAFGPWNWPIPNPFVLYSFLLLVQIALWFGYKSGLKGPPAGYSGRWKINKLLLISLLLNLAWILPNYYSRLGQKLPTTHLVVGSIISGFTDPGSMYREHQEFLTKVEKTGSPLAYLSMVICPLLWMLLPLSVLYWERLKNWMRIGAVLCVAMDLLSWVAIGTNKGLADFGMLLPWLLLARSPLMLVKIKLRRLGKLVAVGIVLVAAVLIFFFMGIYGRGSGGVNLYDPVSGIEADTNNIVMRCLPPSAQGGYAGFTSYLAQGYYGLSLALEEPFVWTYGLGNSYFLAGLSAHLFGPDTISDMTYPARIEKYGWDRFRSWHTFYTWAACDVSFPGVLLVVYFIGRLFAMVWMDTLRKENPFAVAFFALLIIMLYYFPLNNQVLEFSPTAIPFGIFLFLWLNTRRHTVPAQRHLYIRRPTNARVEQLPTSARD